DWVASAGIRRARQGGGPTLIECKGSRYYGHCEGDAQTYRAPDEVENIRRDRDCLDAFRRRATSAGVLSEDELDVIDAEVAQLVEDAVAEAKAAPEPALADLTTDVYVSY